MTTVLPAMVFVCGNGLVHAIAGGCTSCYIGPVVASKMFPPAALHPDREWCGKCFPGSRCSMFGCRIPCGDAGECLDHLADSIRIDTAHRRNQC